MELRLTETAAKDLKKLNKVTQKQIVRKLKFFLDQPDPLRYAAKLSSFSQGGQYRFRVGRYRAVFDVAKDIIYVLHIEHRRDVYRKK